MGQAEIFMLPPRPTVLMLVFRKCLFVPREKKYHGNTMSKNKHNTKRRGVATVEFAVILPVMVLILMGTIECTSMIFLQQSLEIVCYETVRAASRPQTLAADALLRADELIVDRALNDCVVTIDPPVLSTMAQGAAITVTATAGTTENAFFPVTFFPDDLVAEAVMVRQ